MKTFYAIVLLAFVGLAILSCSDQSQSPVAAEEQSSLDKVMITEYTFTNSPEPFTADPYDYMNVAGRTTDSRQIL